MEEKQWSMWTNGIIFEIDMQGVDGQGHSEQLHVPSSRWTLMEHVNCCKDMQ